MNGLIASVMALMMTGMVFGYQPQHSNLNSGNGSNLSDRPGRFVVPMGEDEVQFLKKFGYLPPAAIRAEERPYIDYVIIVADSRDADRADFAPITISQTASSDADSKIEFQFTDSMIDMMRTNGVQYKILSSERGKYDQVVVLYDRSLSSQNNNSNNSQFNRPTRQFERQEKQFSSVQPRNGIPRQGDGYQERSFYGPRITDDFAAERRRQQLLDNSNSPTFTPRFDSTANRRNTNIQDDYETRRLTDETRANANTFDSQRVPRVGGDRDFTSTRNRDEFKSQSDWERRQRLEDDRVVRERERDFTNSTLSPRITRNSQGFGDSPRRESNARTNEFEFRNAADRLRPTESDLLAAENEALKRELLDAEYEKQRKNRELEDAERYARRLEAADRQRENEMEDLKYRADSRRLVGTPRDPSRYREDYDGIIVGGTRDTGSYTHIPNRNNASPQPTNKPPTFEIQGPTNQEQPTLVANADLVRMRQQNRALWFIMICSVAINFYLSWIARGFYVRYEELADEIRDTFTSTM